MRRSLLQSIGLGFTLLVLLVLANEASAGACPNEAVRAGLQSAGLPDCRAYEMVSPAGKYGWPLFVTRISTNGDRALAFGLGGLAGSNQVSLLNYYEFIREPKGWASVPLNTPAGYASGPISGGEALADPTLTSGLFEYSLSGAAENDSRYFVRGLPDGLPVQAGPRVPQEAIESIPASERLNSSEASASSDMSRVLFTLSGPQYAKGNFIEYIWPGDTTALNPGGAGWNSLYEYVGSANTTPSLVGVDSSGHLISECGTSLGYPAGGAFTSLQSDEIYNAVSSPSGSRVFFTVAPGGPCGEEGLLFDGPPTSELFASEEISPGVRRSIPISEPSTGAEGACSACDTSNPQPGTFQGASEDGSRVFFLSNQHLLEGAHGQSLFEYDFNAEVGKHVTLIAPDVQGLSRVSESGSRVYFVATGVLTSSPNPIGDVAEHEADNLYVYDTDTGTPSFVGTLSESDAADWQLRDERPVDASPDGRFLVFTSSADLTHDGAGGVSQVFEYDAETKGLLSVSRVQGGSGGAFSASIVYPQYTGHLDPAPQPSSVSDNGSVVVFQSEAALTSQAILGHNNVYEYHSGRLSLISDGYDRSVRDGGFPTVMLVGVDGSGKDIFFTTANPLVPQDGDTQEDVYDARIGGGFLPSPSPACEGEGCQGPLAPSLSLASSGSLGQPAGEQLVEPPVKPTPKVKAKVKRKTKKAKRGRKALKARRHGARGTAQRSKRK